MLSRGFILTKPCIKQTYLCITYCAERIVYFRTGHKFILAEKMSSISTGLQVQLNLINILTGQLKHQGYKLGTRAAAPITHRTVNAPHVSINRNSNHA